MTSKEIRMACSKAVFEAFTHKGIPCHGHRMQVAVNDLYAKVWPWWKEELTNHARARIIEEKQNPVYVYFAERKIRNDLKVKENKKLKNRIKRWIDALKVGTKKKVTKTGGVGGTKDDGGESSPV